MKVVPYIIGTILIVYNIISVVYGHERQLAVTSRFNRIGLSVLLLSFVIDGLVSGTIRFRAYDVAKDNNKSVFYTVIALYVAGIAYLLSGLW